MAGWTEAAAPAVGDDWSNADYILEFIEAINERWRIAGSATNLRNIASTGPTTYQNIPLTAAGLRGWDVQYGAWGIASVIPEDTISIRSLQEWIESMCTSFVKEMTYDGTATVPTSYASWTAFLTDTLGQASWRAYEVHPDDAGADQIRKIEVGDIIGYWIWEDLKTACDALVWTLETCAWNLDGAAHNRWPYEVDGLWFTRQEAIDHAELVSDANSSYDDDAAPGEHCSVGIDPVGEILWLAGCMNAGNNLYATGISNPNIYGSAMEHLLDYYALLNDASTTNFYPHTESFSVAYEDDWYIFDTEASSSSTAQRSRLFGDTGWWPGDWPAGEGSQGWQAGGVKTIAKWNTANGFKYY